MASLDVLTGRHATTSFDFVQRGEPVGVLVLGSVDLRECTVAATATVKATETREVPPTAAIAIEGPILVSPLSVTVGSPVVFVWRGRQLSPALTAHAEVTLAVGPDATVNPDGSFGTVAATYHSMHPILAFEVDASAGDDGSGPWVAFPDGGLSPSQQGRLQRLTVAVASGQWDWKVRLSKVVT